MPGLGSAIRWGLGLGAALGLVVWYMASSMLIRAPMQPESPPTPPPLPGLVALVDTVAILAAPVLLLAIGAVAARQARPRAVRDALAAGALGGLAASVPVYAFAISPGVVIGVGMVPLVSAMPLMDPQPTREAAAQIMKDAAVTALWAAPLWTIGTGAALGLVGAVCGAAYHLIASRVGRKAAAPQPASPT